MAKRVAKDGPAGSKAHTRAGGGESCDASKEGRDHASFHVVGGDGVVLARDGKWQVPEREGDVAVRRTELGHLGPKGVIVGIALLSCTWGFLGLGAAAAAQKTRLVIAHYFMPGSFGTDVHYNLMNQFVQEFQRLHPELEVVHEPYDYSVLVNGKMITLLMTGGAPTVWLSPNVYNLGFAAQGFLLDLTNWIRRSPWVARDFIEPVLQSNADQNGRIWGFPQGLQLVGLYYNTDMFTAKGLSFPDTTWTWDDYATAARRLVRLSGDRVEIYGATVQAGYPYTGWSLFRSLGGEPFDKTGTKSTLISDAMRSAIQYMATGVQQRYFLLAGSLSDLRNVAMGLDQYVRVATLRKLGVPFNVTAVPRGPKGRFNPVVANSWVITASASPDAQQAAWKWIEYYSTASVQKRWALFGDAAPSNLSAAREVFLSPEASPSGLRDFILSMQDADWIGNNPVWESWYLGGWAPIIDKAVKGEIGPEEALVQANQAAQVALDRFYKR